MRLVSCALLGATLVLVCLPQVRGDEKKPTWRSLRYRQVLTDETLGDGTYTTTFTKDGEFKLEIRNYGVAGAAANADEKGRLSDEELAALQDRFEHADTKKLLLKPAERATAHEPGFGDFTLTIEYEGGAVKTLTGAGGEFPGLHDLRDLLTRRPASVRQPGDLTFTLLETGPRVGDEEPWTLEFTITKGADLEGRYKHLRGTPSGRRNGTFRGKASEAFLKTAYEHPALLHGRPAHATKGTTFTAKLSNQTGSYWVSGFLEDYPEVAQFAKALGDEGGRLDALSKIQVERAGLAPPAVPESIAEKYDGPIDPSGVIATR